MITIEEVFKDKPYPNWIKEHTVFTKLTYIRKIFSDIDLPNFEDKILVDNSKEITSYANSLMCIIADYLLERFQKLEKFALKAKIGKKRRGRLNLLLNAMKQLIASLRNNKNGFIVLTATGKISLNIPEDIIHNDTIFMKKGAGLFKLYEKINSLLEEDKFLTLPDLTQAQQFKNFSSINIPAKTTSIIFSSGGADGIWDIATMSMRGISSCRTWDQGAYNNSVKVLGSIIDPFTAIIYLTCGTPFNKYGTKMIRRCIVRYVLDNTSKAPYLLLEKMYPAYDKPSLDAFIAAIKQRNAELPIYYAPNLGERATYGHNKLSQSFIPLSEELKMLDKAYHPYVDSYVAFKEDASCTLSSNAEASKIIFKKRMPFIFEKAIRSHYFKKDNLQKLDKSSAKIISQIRGKTDLDPNADQICKCEKVGCNRLHFKDDEVPNVDANAKPLINALGNQFAEFVCVKTEKNNPFKYLSEHQKECATFFTNCKELPIKEDLANFIVSGVVDYIEKNK